ncbi:sulfatase [Flavivirga abyssicola]|uniref:sulfatase n=1 Tax=Flavivirga abyssicola TaxID=3063533 RepID=UPI0026E03B84|nr:sulfatase [Flavivirga sp. MEBiC07777]WVK13802.1 sulfatase [Flavivirga sp. MEBiC07777]
MRFYTVVFLVFLCFSCDSTHRNKKPNVILFVVDDLGWTDLSSFGSDLYQTPNVDKLVANGVKFTNAYASCTVCSPSRSSIMTGKYPARINCTDWIAGHQKPFAKMKVPDWTKQVNLDEITLAEALKNEGYNTIHLGKWHLGEEDKYWPENQGFDINIGGWAKGAPQKRKESNGYFSPYGNPRLKDGTENEYLTERLASEAVQYLESNRDSDSPFFMNFWFYNVHTPLQAKQEKIDKYKAQITEITNHKNATYAAMVEHMDDAVGNIISKLKELDILDNTLIIFTSDNGGLIGNYGSREQVTSNFPLRSGKGDMYEGGVRVPFIVQWPNKILKGKTVDIPLISPDIYPTILGLTETMGNTAHNKNMDGVDFSKVLMAEDKLDRASIFWHYPHYHLEGAKPYSAIRKGHWKLIETFENDGLELYNLKEDIGETKDLVLDNPKKVAELMKDLNAWRTKVNAQIPEENPNFNEDFKDIYKKGKWVNKSDDEFLQYLKISN